MLLNADFYYKQYKNDTVKQLKRRLKNLQSPQHLDFLRRLRREEIKDNVEENAWVDHHTSIDVINLLIEYKTLYPDSDLSDWDNYQAIKNAVEQNAGAVTR